MREALGLAARPCLVAVIVLAAAGGHTSAGQARTQRIYVPQAGGKAQYKPSEIVLSADGGNVWKIGRWLTYGGRTADAIAVTSHDDCKPSCADGRRVSSRTRIRFSGSVSCGGVLAYAWFQVIASTRKSVAPVGEVQDLESLCPGVESGPRTVMWLTSPSGNIECEISRGRSRGRYAYCQTSIPARSARLNVRGRTRVCRGTRCLGDGPQDALVLAYETSFRLGPFRCRSLVTGMRCRAVKNGHGFRISREGVSRF